MSFSPILGYALGASAPLKYALIAFAAPLGGPLLILAAGFLLHEGLVTLPWVFLAIAFGELFLDSLWYAIGYRYAAGFIKRYGHFFSVTPELFLRTETFFNKKGPFMLLISKITMGFGMTQVIFMTAGATRVRFSLFMLMCSLGEIIWVSLILFIGYSYADLYGTLQKDAKILLLGGTIILLIPFVVGFSGFLRKKTLKEIR